MVYPSSSTFPLSSGYFWFDRWVWNDVRWRPLCSVLPLCVAIHWHACCGAVCRHRVVSNAPRNVIFGANVAHMLIVHMHFEWKRSVSICPSYGSVRVALHVTVCLAAFHRAIDLFTPTRLCISRSAYLIVKRNISRVSAHFQLTENVFPLKKNDWCFWLEAMENVYCNLHNAGSYVALLGDIVFFYWDLQKSFYAIMIAQTRHLNVYKSDPSLDLIWAK